MTAADVHTALSGGQWLATLVKLGGLPDAAFRGKYQNKPCPSCGGTDRFTFDNRRDHGDWICRHCQPGGGDGFDLLRAVHGWRLQEAMAEVLRLEGVDPARPHTVATSPASAAPVASSPAVPSRGALHLLQTSTDVELVSDVRAYLAHRNVWPLPPGHGLRAHTSARYFGEAIPPDSRPRYVGRFAALLAPVIDVGGALVTVHATYLKHGRKLVGHAPRKLQSPLRGRTGCAVRLAPLGPVLGIAEGIETALAAMQLHRVPVWAALNAGELAKFEPPAGVRKLLVYADRDNVGLRAAEQLMGRLRITSELCVPPDSHNDWADVLAMEVGKQ